MMANMEMNMDKQYASLWACMPDSSEFVFNFNCRHIVLTWNPFLILIDDAQNAKCFSCVYAINLNRGTVVSDFITV